MAARTYAQVAPTADTMALNAYIYGYGGHSLVTPHAALKRLWWTEERINHKVDRAFVLSKLRGQERGFLDQTVGFGEASGAKSDAESVDVLGGLTSDTYLDWILTRARRLFLILAEIGVPDQIFGCIDDLWDDDDLPLTMESIRKLELTIEDDAVLEQKFYDTQFIYMLRELKKGNHIDYDAREHIPIEHVDQLPPAVSVQEYGGRVHFPARPEQVFMRRKLILKEKGSEESEAELFKGDVLHAQNLAHPNIAPVFASYTSGDAGFILSNFVVEHTLATYFDHRTPPSFMRVPAAKRPVLLQQWMLSLADALAYLHENGEAHTAICPSNIWIDRDNHIVFADLGKLTTFRKAKKLNKTELYDYAAPESISREGSTSIFGPSLLGPDTTSIFRKPSMGRKPASSVSRSMSKSNANKDDVAQAMSSSKPVEEATSSVHRTGRFDFKQQLPSTVIVPAIFDTQQSTESPEIVSERTCSQTQAPITSAHQPPGSAEQASPHGRSSARPPSAEDARPSSSSSMFFDPIQADIFSLACIYLNILTFVLEGKLTDFVRFRSYALNAFKQRRYRADQSFHSDAEILNGWLTHLGTACDEKLAAEEAAGVKGSVAAWKSVPALLSLIGRMLSHNGASRPLADEVQRTIEAILKNDDSPISSSVAETARLQSHVSTASSQTASDRVPSLKRTSGSSDDRASSAQTPIDDLCSSEDPNIPTIERLFNSSAIDDEDDMPSPEFVSPSFSKLRDFRRFSVVSVLAGKNSSLSAPNAQGRMASINLNPLGFRSTVDLQRPGTSNNAHAGTSALTATTALAGSKANPPSKLMRMQVMDDMTPLRATKTRPGSGSLRSLKSIFSRSSKSTAQAT
jgi:serine/threonine protein kinase